MLQKMSSKAKQCSERHIYYNQSHTAMELMQLKSVFENMSFMQSFMSGLPPQAMVLMQFCVNFDKEDGQVLTFDFLTNFDLAETHPKLVEKVVALENIEKKEVEFKVQSFGEHYVDVIIDVTF